MLLLFDRYVKVNKIRSIVVAGDEKKIGEDKMVCLLSKYNITFIELMCYVSIIYWWTAFRRPLLFIISYGTFYISKQ